MNSCSRTLFLPSMRSLASGGDSLHDGVLGRSLFLTLDYSRRVLWTSKSCRSLSLF